MKLDKKYLISIIINCLNGEKYLKESIDSIYFQTYKNWEIIFWDNNSNDKSAEIAKSYDSKLRYFRSENFCNLYLARNKAIQKCKGEITTFLDCDDIWVKDKLEVQLKHFNSNNKFIYGGYSKINEKNEFINEKVIPNKNILSSKDILLKNDISIGCVMIETKLLKKFKFDPYYELLGDFDLWIRISKNNKIIGIKNVLELSRIHPENYSKQKIKLWTSERRHFYKKFIQENKILKNPFIVFYILKTEFKEIINQFKNFFIG